jgi:hypothetical protein
MTVAAYYFSDQTDSSIDAFQCDSEEEAVLEIVQAMKSLKNTSILTTAEQYTKSHQFDAALHCLDVWVEEFSVGANVFSYTVKDE